ncbi:MAG: hypothetical protein ACHQ49_14820 [Elusimicrobiota bacterium]
MTPPPNLTPFDLAIAHINRVRYHNHRTPEHSDIVSEGIFQDLLRTCEVFRRDHEEGVIRKWLNVKSPGDRERSIDLFVGEVDPSSQTGAPNIALVRFCCENKSVITAHRNAVSRFDDLTKVLGSIHAARPQAIIIATVLVGISERCLNVPDKVRSIFQGTDAEFDQLILPRLSSGDESLYTEFRKAVSKNTQSDIKRTLSMFRKRFQVREPAMTHEKKFDHVLLVPVRIDNVHPAEVARDNPYDIDIDREYQQMLHTICAAYRARLHPMD